MIQTKNILISYFFTILVISFVTLPFYHRFLIERGELAQEKEKIEREDLRLATITEVERELAPYIEILNKIKTAIPADPALPSLIKHLELIVSASGLQLDSIGSFSVSEPAEGSRLRKTKVEIKVLGHDYQSLKDFIKELERSMRIIVIESASISTVTEEEGADGGTRFALSLSIKTYSY